MRARALLLSLLLPLTACEDVLDDLFSCDLGGAPDLEGQWTLRGHGVRTGCADPRLDGDFSIATAAPLDVVQDHDFSESRDYLSLGTPVPGFTLTGELDDHCFVVFDVVEENPEGTVVYHFTGDPDALDGPRIERGSLTGEGPGSCVLTGSYEVTITP